MHSTWLIAATLAATPQTRDLDVRRSSLTGTIEHHREFESKVLGNRRDLWIYLPPGYAQGKGKYPVLYMHDGQNLFDGKISYLPNQEWRADEAAESLIQAGMIKPLIIVGIANAGAERANEYLPTRFKAGNNEFGGKADLYGRFVVEEVMPWVNQRYRTLTGVRNTGLAGSSFGGIITLYMGLKYPNHFGRLGVFSPSLWINNREPLRWIGAVKKPANPQLWMDMGTEGPGSMESAREAFEALKKQGFAERNLRLYLDNHAQHNEAAWARRFPLMLTWMYAR